MRILLVEDNPEDIRTIWNMLHEKSKFQFSVDSVSRLKPALHMLTSNPADVVLLDLSLLTHEDETSAVRSILEVAPYVAVLVLTGLENEQAGLRAIEAGAQDYILKHEIGTRALVRALHYALERRHAANRLRIVEELYHSTINSILDYAIVSLDAHGIINEWHPGIEHLFGYRSEDLLGRFVGILYSESDQQTGKAHGDLDKVRGNGVVELDHFFAHRDGTPLYVSGTIRRVNDVRGVLTGFVMVLRDTTLRQRMEQVLRDSEAQQAFMFQLSEALRSVIDPLQIQEVSARLLGEHLGVARVAYGEILGEEMAIHIDYAQDVLSLKGRYPLEVFGEATLTAFRRGEPVVVQNIATDSSFTKVQRASYKALQIASYVGVAIVKQGAWVAGIGVYSDTPRTWTQREIDLIQDVAERTWEAVERAAAEAALRASEEKYRTLFNSIDEGFSILELIEDEHGKVVDYWMLEVNPAQEKLTGIKGSGGKRIREVAPNVEDYWLESFAQVARTGEPLRIENWSGDVQRWFAIHISRMDGPEPNRVAVVFSNITEQKLAEQKLRRSEAHQSFLLKLSDALRPRADPVEVQIQAVRVLAEHIGASRIGFAEDQQNDRDVIVRYDYTNGVPSSVGDYQYQHYGDYLIGEYKAGRKVVRFNVAEDPQLTAEQQQAYASMQIAASADIPVVKDGRLRFVMFVHFPQPHLWTDDEVDLLTETAERVWVSAEHARAEAALRHSQNLLQRAFSIETVGVMFFRLSGPMTEVNDAFVRMSGYSREALLGMSQWQTLTPPEFADVAKIAAADLAVYGETQPYEKQMVKADGSRWWGMFAPTCISGRGPDAQCVEFILDITERKQFEQQNAELLRREQVARQQAERAVSTQRLFLGMISHELRTPLASIKGFSSTLTATDVTFGPEQARTFLEIIDQEADKLTLLIDQLLDVVRMEGGAFQLMQEEVTLSDILSGINAQVNTLAAQHHLVIDSPEYLPALFVDKQRIGQVITNLVGNAVKFSPPQSQITVSARSFEKFVQVTVKDEGAGIPPSERTSVFEVFHQGPPERGRPRGAGLGLSICKRLVEAHGGSIWVEEQPVSGTAISFTLPIASR